PVGVGEHLHREESESEERSAPSSQGARQVAPRWRRSSAEGGCREDGAEGRGAEGEDRAPPSQASPGSWPTSGVEEEGGMSRAWQSPTNRSPSWRRASPKTFTAASSCTA